MPTDQVKDVVVGPKGPRNPGNDEQKTSIVPILALGAAAWYFFSKKKKK